MLINFAPHTSLNGVCTKYMHFGNVSSLSLTARKTILNKISYYRFLACGLLHSSSQEKLYYISYIYINSFE